MDNGNKVDNCEHRREAWAYWLRNDGMGPPVLYLETGGKPVVVTMTNQVIYVKCPICFSTSRRYVEATSLPEQ